MQKQLLVHTVRIAPYSGVNAYGESSHGTERTAKARIQENIKKVSTDSGSEVVSTVQVYLDAADAISVLDKLTLPDGRTPPIIRVAPYTDLLGNLHHQVVYT